MPDQDPQPIELRLRAYAEQRRAEAGGPFTPPPGTRRRVRAEVDRRWGQAAQTRDEGRWWDAMWPRLGWALGVTALLVIVSLAVLDLRPPASSTTLAKKPDFGGENAPADLMPGLLSQPQSVSGAIGPTARGIEEPTATTVAAEAARESAALSSDAFVARTESPPPSAATSGQPSSQPASYGLAMNQAPQPTPALAVTPAGSLAPPAVTTQGAAPATTALRSDSLAMRPTPAPGRVASISAPPPEPAVAAPGRSQRDSALATNTARFAASPLPARVSNQQQFVQAPVRARRQNINSPPPPPVLQRFEVRQLGTSLQVRDGDGSLYAAELSLTLNQAVPAPLQPPARTAPRSQTAAASRTEAATAGQNQSGNNLLFFNAAGTNRTLQQRVVFEGRLLYTNQAIPAPPAAAAATNDAALGVWLNNSLIEGAAVIGGRTTIEIQAVPDRR